MMLALLCASITSFASVSDCQLNDDESAVMLAAIASERDSKFPALLKGTTDDFSKFDPIMLRNQHSTIEWVSAVSNQKPGSTTLVSNVPKGGPQISDGLRADFKEKNQQVCNLPQSAFPRMKLWDPDKGHMLNADESLRPLHRKYGPDLEMFQISRVGFNSTHTRAVVHLSASGSYQNSESAEGTGYFLYLEKLANQNW